MASKFARLCQLFRIETLMRPEAVATRHLTTVVTLTVRTLTARRCPWEVGRRPWCHLPADSRS